MEKYRIWKFYDNEKAMLIVEDDILEVSLTADTMLIEGITVKEVDNLNEKMKVWKEENNDWVRDPDNLREWLREFAGIENVEVEWAGDFEDVKEIVVYCGGSFADLRDYDRTTIYQWWDGSNIRTEWIDQVESDTSVLVDEDFVSLGEYSVGDHAQVYKVIELDGVEVEGTYLIREWSQWQGVHDAGTVVKKDELPEVLTTEYGIDPEDYMDEILNL